MKVKDFDSYTRMRPRHGRNPGGHGGGPNIGTALLGIACVIGVFAVLTLLYHYG